MRRVVITAASVVGPTARGYQAFAQALREGRSGGGPVTLFDASAFPTRIAAEVKDFDEQAPFDALASAAPGLNDTGMRREDRKTALGLAAALDLKQAAGVDDWASLPCAVHLGTGLSSASVSELEADLLPFIDGRGNFDPQAYGKVALQTGSPSPWRHLTTEVNRLIMSAWGLRGPSTTNFAACAASTQAIGRAYRDVQAGRVERAIAGGMDSMIHPFGMISFMRLGALTTRNDSPLTASRPFDKHRDGFLIAEGAAMVLVEALEVAQARGAHILAEIIGYGTSLDAHAITAPHPQGRGAQFAMSRALKDAHIEAQQVGYINAHGTGTALNDGTESGAICAVWRERGLEPPPVSSTKSMTGHLIAAAGAIEAVACVAALKGSFLPPTINLQEQDPACEIDAVADGQGRPVEDLDVVMNNSFGFGGQNAALLLRRWRG